VAIESAEQGELQREEAMLNSTPEVNPTESPETGAITLRTLFECEESNLLRFAFSLTGRRAVSEEIVQEVFLQLHAKWSEVQEPRAWLIRSVRNRAFHYWRKHRRERTDNDEKESALQIESAEKSPDMLIEQMETVAELRQLISELPEKDRRLVQLKYYENLKYRDISQQTGLTISNVGFRLHQVLKKLAAGLLPRGVEDES
jgi:RNA polymerase sigma-70 factor (ECF subfamily)